MPENYAAKISDHDASSVLIQAAELAQTLFASDFASELERSQSVAMLSFFPKPYPDEILYSVLARYHIRSGNMGPKLTVQELFNSNNAIATADLPCNLEALATNLSLISQITGEELIQNHTLYRFYAAFLPQERSQQILEAMRSGDGGGIHDRVGIRASLVY